MSAITTTGRAACPGPAPADRALAKVAELLLEDGFGYSVPAWDGDAYLKINNALRAITDLTLTRHGNLTWEYRSVQCPHLHPSRLVGMAIELLDPDHTRREPNVGTNAGYPLVEIIRYALYRYGFTATIAETGPVTHCHQPSPALPGYPRHLRRRRTVLVRPGTLTTPTAASPCPTSPPPSPAPSTEHSTRPPAHNP